MAITLRTKQVLICILVLLTILAVIAFLEPLPVAVQSWGPHPSIAYQNYGP